RLKRTESVRLPAKIPIKIPRLTAATGKSGFPPSPPPRATRAPPKTPLMPRSQPDGAIAATGPLKRASPRYGWLLRRRDRSRPPAVRRRVEFSLGRGLACFAAADDRT